MDFTEVSDNAFRYAYQMTGGKGHFTIVHVISGFVEASIVSGDESTESRNERIARSLTGRVCAEMQWKGLSQNVKILLLEGDVIGSLKRHIANEMYDSIVMGTRDNYDIIDRWFGTISLGVVKTLQIPVYLIPRHSKYRKFKKVLIASDYHLLDKELIARIVRWNKTYEAFIEFLHIRGKKLDKYEESKEQILNTLIDADELNFAFQLKTIESRDVAGSILTSAYKENSDLLILIAENRSFVNTLLFKSLSRDMILKSDIPVLFIHD